MKLVIMKKLFFYAYLIAETQASLSCSVSAWNVLSITVVHCKPLITNTKGLGLSQDIIWHPRTVKLFSGCACWSFSLKPFKLPSSLRMKYLDLQFFMCSPEISNLNKLKVLSIKLLLLIFDLLNCALTKKFKFYYFYYFEEIFTCMLKMFHMQSKFNSIKCIFCRQKNCKSMLHKKLEEFLLNNMLISCKK